MPDDKAVHLGMIQVVITRMGANSFVIKGWNVTLASALLALSVKDGSSRFVLVAFLPALVFWTLDAYYLRQERLFRKLYDEASEPQPIVKLFAMSTAKYEDQVETLVQTMFSTTVIVLHGIVFASIFLVLYFVNQPAH